MYAFELLQVIIHPVVFDCPGEPVKDRVDVFAWIASFRVNVKEQALPEIGIFMDSVLVIKVAQ